MLYAHSNFCFSIHALVSLRKPQWHSLQCFVGINVVSDRSDANFFVTEDAANPSQRIKWTVALQGGTVACLILL